MGARGDRPATAGSGFLKPWPLVELTEGLGPRLSGLPSRRWKAAFPIRNRRQQLVSNCWGVTRTSRSSSRSGAGNTPQPHNTLLLRSLAVRGAAWYSHQQQMSTFPAMVHWSYVYLLTSMNKISSKQAGYKIYNTKNTMKSTEAIQLFWGPHLTVKHLLLVSVDPLSLRTSIKIHQYLFKKIIS